MAKHKVNSQLFCYRYVLIVGLTAAKNETLFTEDRSANEEHLPRLMSCRGVLLYDKWPYLWRLVVAGLARSESLHKLMTIRDSQIIYLFFSDSIRHTLKTWHHDTTTKVSKTILWNVLLYLMSCSESSRTERSITFIILLAEDLTGDTFVSSRAERVGEVLIPIVNLDVVPCFGRS